MTPFEFGLIGCTAFVALASFFVYLYIVEQRQIEQNRIAFVARQQAANEAAAQAQLTAMRRKRTSSRHKSSKRVKATPQEPKTAIIESNQTIARPALKVDSAATAATSVAAHIAVANVGVTIDALIDAVKAKPSKQIVKMVQVPKSRSVQVAKVAQVAPKVADDKPFYFKAMWDDDYPLSEPMPQCFNCGAQWYLPSLDFRSGPSCHCAIATCVHVEEHTDEVHAKHVTVAQEVQVAQQVSHHHHHRHVESVKRPSFYEVESCVFEGPRPKDASGKQCRSCGTHYWIQRPGPEVIDPIKLLMTTVIDIPSCDCPGARP